MKKLVSMVMGVVAFAAFAEYDPATAAAQAVSDVVVRQEWPWSTKVVVTFRVSGLDATNAVDVAISGSIGGRPIDIPSGVVKGAKRGLENGTWELTLDPADIPSLVEAKSVKDFRVHVTPTLSALDPSVPFYSEVLYMIVDLQATNPNKSVEYLAGRDIISGDYGAYVCAPEWIDGSTVNSLIWTGVNSNNVYKTTKLVLRRIPGGNFNMGSPNGEQGRAETSVREDFHPVTLTKDYWMGVFEVTQKQWSLVVGGSNPSQKKGDTHPIESVSYKNIRGSDVGTNWPIHDEVDETSFMALLRAKTNVRFDLPTEAQWEYACRAGTSTSLNNGQNITADQICPNLTEIARYNGTKEDNRGGVSSHHTLVGCYLPNAWGLYDMHGNVWEWCLDWYKDSLGTSLATDPLGPVADNANPVKHTDGISYRMRILRGGAWRNDARNCRSAFRSRGIAANGGSDSGFRLACPAE